MLRVVALVALSACGRFQFADLPDASATALVDGSACSATGTNDDDADGIVDRCDLCPAVADSAQGDADQDGVGDACDPTAGVDRITVFDPFSGTTLAARWMTTGSPTVANSQLVIPAGSGTTAIGYPGNTTLTELAIRGRVLGVGSSGGSQLSLQYGTASTLDDGEYCELYGSTNPKFRITRFVNPNYTVLSASLPVPTVTPGPFTLRFGNTAQGMSCDLEIGGVPYHVTTTSTFAAPRAHTYVQLIDTAAVIDSFVEITTP